MRIINRMAVAAAVGLAVGALALGGPAQAQAEHYPAAGWQVRQIGIGDTDWSPAEASAIVDPLTVGLTKPDGTTGTSIETTNLGLPLAAGQTVSVEYALINGAEPTAGAVRLFIYDSPDADTLAEAPYASVAADAASGVLSIGVGADIEIGTMGLVFDASNASTGTVKFSNLTVGNTTVLFVEPPALCEVPGLEDLLASDSDCQDPTPTPTVEPSVEPSTEPSTEPVGAANDDVGELPMTGSKMPLLVAAGMAALVGGGLLLWFGSQRRRLRRLASQ